MRLPVLVAAAVLCTGCGYVGDPLPPALNIPSPVTDLAVVQRADKLLIRFTAPSVTTEQLPIRSFGRIEVRIGPVTQPFSFDAWAAGSQVLPVPLPEPGAAVNADTPSAPWSDRDIIVAARLVSVRERAGAWSNPVSLTPRAPLARPAATAAGHAEGVELRWPGTPGIQYRIRKQAEGAPDLTALATVDAPPFVDKAVELGRTYTYDVQAASGLVESEVSNPVRITVRDDFAPKAPAGVTVVGGRNSAELAWERNTEPDLASYRVYRSEGTAEFTLVADAVDAVAYSDRQVQSGKTYRYRVTAVDRTTNESQPSAVVQATIPQ